MLVLVGNPKSSKVSETSMQSNKQLWFENTIL